MSKPILYNTFQTTDADSDELTVQPWSVYISIETKNDVLHFKDPSKLRILAAEIGKAADALEASQRVTFGDLTPGDYFQYPYGPSVYMKADCGQVVGPDGATWIFSTNDAPVTRMVAVFSPFSVGNK